MFNGWWILNRKQSTIIGVIKSWLLKINWSVTSSLVIRWCFKALLSLWARVAQSVAVASDYGLHRRSSISGRCKKITVLTSVSRPALGSPILLSSWYWVSFPRGWSRLWSDVIQYWGEERVGTIHTLPRSLYRECSGSALFHCTFWNVV